MKITEIKKVLIVVAALITGGCTEQWLDVNDNPNQAKEASLDLLLPAAQVSAGFNLTRSTYEFTSVFVRHFYGLSESQYNHDGSIYNNDFRGLFAGALKDLEEIITQGTDQERWHYVGIAQVCKAYIYMMSVDMWGDLPFDEALKGETIYQPQYLSDAEVYNQLFALLDEAQENLAKEDLDVNGDLMYNGNINRWARAANSIRLRMFIVTRNLDPDGAKSGVESIIAGDQFISANAHDFEFVFGEAVAPLNQHPIYQQEYAGAGNKIFHMDNYFMYNLIKKEDPRLRYYIYRQDDGSSLSFETYPCAARNDCIYGYLGDHPDFPGGEGAGYIGRDHGDPSGIPGDDEIRSTFGVYPIGGSYDDGAFEERTNENGTGAGVIPYITNFMVNFYLAEAALTLQTEGGGDDIVKSYLEAGIRASMSKVQTFALENDPQAPAMDPAAVDDYVTARMNDYDAAANTEQKLNVIIKEKYYACWGNGLESYTDYRRTGFPADLPPSLAPVAPFPLRLYYGTDEVATNPNAVQKNVSEPIFWDVD